MNEDDNTNWWDWDDEIKNWSYKKTEDYIFAPYHNGGKRIGDVARDELIHVIAMGYYEREQLAKELVKLCLLSGIESDQLAHARAIVDRVARKTLVWHVSAEGK